MDNVLLHPQITNVHLRVQNLEETSGFYQDLFSMQKVHESNSQVTLESESGLSIFFYKAKKAHNSAHAGLYHHAFLLRSIPDLAAFVKEKMMKKNYRFGGSDHGVSIALYLYDPEGNGIEVYADRPKAQWPRDVNNHLAMTSDHIDMEALLNQASSIWDEEVTLGHVHLRAVQVNQMEAFYRILGFDVMQKMPGATFMSIDDYHHHIAFNAWSYSPVLPHDGSGVNMDHLEVRYEDKDALMHVLSKLNVSGFSVEKKGNIYWVNDPSHIHVSLIIA